MYSSVYVSMYVCVYVCMYACMYCMHVCMHVQLYAFYISIVNSVGSWTMEGNNCCRDVNQTHSSHLTRLQNILKKHNDNKQAALVLVGQVPVALVAVDRLNSTSRRCLLAS
jgi:hypothetical protein